MEDKIELFTKRFPKEDWQFLVDALNLMHFVSIDTLNTMNAVNQKEIMRHEFRKEKSLEMINKLLDVV